MHFQYIQYIWPLLASALVSMSLGLYALALRKRKVKGTASFMLSMFIVTVWSAGNALEMAAPIYRPSFSGQTYSTLLTVFHLWLYI